MRFWTGRLLILSFCFSGALYASDDESGDGGKMSSRPSNRQVHPAGVAANDSKDDDGEDEITVRPTTVDFPPPGEALDEESYEPEITQAHKEIPFLMRNIWFRDVAGLFSGVTTPAVPKILAGTSAICLSKIALGLNVIQPESAPKIFLGNVSMSDLIASGSMLDFSAVTPSFNNATNTTSYAITSYSRTSPTHLAEQTTYWGMWLGGLSIASGIIDFGMAAYTTVFSKGGNFKSLVHEAIERRKALRRKLDDIGLFLLFAKGKYHDLYQKRGAFNRDEFIELLVRY